MALFRPPAASKQRVVGWRDTGIYPSADPLSPYSTSVPFTLPQADRSLLPSPDSVEKFAGRYWYFHRMLPASARVDGQSGRGESPRSGGNENQQTSSDHAVFIERCLRARCPARDRALQESS